MKKLIFVTCFLFSPLFSFAQMADMDVEIQAKLSVEGNHSQSIQWVRDTLSFAVSDAQGNVVYASPAIKGTPSTENGRSILEFTHFTSFKAPPGATFKIASAPIFHSETGENLELVWDADSTVTLNGQPFPLSTLQPKLVKGQHQQEMRDVKIDLSARLNVEGGNPDNFHWTDKAISFALVTEGGEIVYTSPKIKGLSTSARGFGALDFTYSTSALLPKGDLHIAFNDQPKFNVLEGTNCSISWDPSSSLSFNDDVTIPISLIETTLKEK